MAHATRGELGVLVVGAGSIGGLRAKILRRHPSVGYLAVCDIDEAKARQLAQDCNADVWSTDADELVSRPEIGAVVVATTENAHLEPSLAAIAADRPTLVEKPFTVSPEDAAKILAAAQDRRVPVFTGFTQRFRRPFLAVKEHVAQGYVGEVTSVRASIYLTRAVARAVMSRAPETTPSINTLTYVVDLVLWYLAPCRPLAVRAIGSRGAMHEEFGVVDATWALVELEGGAVANLGVSWELPEHWPAYVASMDVDIMGRDGSMRVRDDHAEVIVGASRPIPSPYTPDVGMHVAMPGSAMPGDWAQGEYFGAMKDETYAFVDTVLTGRPHPILPDGRQGERVLRVSRAIDAAVASGDTVPVEWPSEDLG
jgi:predicted dehydrogenase